MNTDVTTDSLNTAQREAVTQPFGDSLVLAGAGSGKTRVLTQRIAWLVQHHNVSPWSILAVTFTNKAAAELRGRIESLLNMPARGMWVGTFHSLAHRLLRTHWQSAGLPENFQIIDSDDQLRLIKRLMKSMEVDDKRWSPREVQGYISRKKEEGLRPDYIEPGSDFYERMMHRLFTAYESERKQLGLVDFSEMLLCAHELWLKHAEILNHYRERFQFILVDEFQDTNALQYAWLRLLTGEKGHFMAVGDDDQSIYGWRGARVENIQRFTEDFPQARVIRLEQNYRSTANILNAANAVIQHNKERLGKKLWTDSNKGEELKLYAAFNEVDEARFIGQTVSTMQSNGMAYRDMAVLYRSNAQSRVLEEAMLRAGIPYRIYGGQRFFERAEIKNALAYLRLIHYPHDDTSFERVINVPPRGIGDKTVQAIRDLAAANGSSMWQSAQTLLIANGLSSRAANATGEFMQLITAWQGVVKDLTLDSLADEVVHNSGLVKMYEQEKGEKGRARIENLEELVSACRQFDPEELESLPFEEQASQVTANNPLEAFLAHVALETGEMQAGAESDCVQMMTMHASKGLEFPLVFISGMEEGLFPSARSVDEGNIAEERRLCYVGITRAKQQLYLTRAETRTLYGKSEAKHPSRFISEIPVELTRGIQLKSQKFSRPVTASGGLGSAEIPGTDFRVGQSIKHPIFGQGAIINFEGEGARASVQVKFIREGVKRLMLAHARLEAL